jgi:hypothetical protein
VAVLGILGWLARRALDATLAHHADGDAGHGPTGA